MDDLDNELYDHLLEALEARGDERAEAIRKAREKLMARRIVQRMKAQSPSKAAWWQNEWFWRAVALAAGLGLALLGQNVKIP